MATPSASVPASSPASARASATPASPLLPMLQVRESLRGLTILVTGATGFVGKILVEKLLRSVPDSGRLYLLIREKKGAQAEVRLRDEIVKSPIFKRLRSERPDDFEEYIGDKLVAVAGDITQEKLGMDPAAYDDLQQRTQLIFHCAASVNFKEPLIDALTKNVVGSLTALEFARGCTRLLLHQHVSTAYVACNRQGWLYEKMYMLKSGDPEEVFHRLMQMEPKAREASTPALLRLEGYPNVYTFTKCLSEHLILRRRANIPVQFYRPTIIGACHHEPMPGWLDVVSAASSLYLTGGLGIIRQMHGDGSRVGDQIPADMVVNSMIVSAVSCLLPSPRTDKVDNDHQSFQSQPQQSYQSSQSQQKLSPQQALQQQQQKKKSESGAGDVEIFTLGTSKNRPVTWELCTRLLLPYWLSHRSNRPVAKLRFHWQPSRTLFLIETFLDYTLPGALFRAYARLLGSDADKKLARQSIKLENVVDKLHSAFAYFVASDWVYDTTNTESLITRLDETKVDMFDFDVRHIEWEHYLRWFGWGLRTYVLKEEAGAVPTNDRMVKLYLCKHHGLLGDVLFATTHSRRHVVDNLRSTMRERKAMVLFSPAVQQAIQTEATLRGEDVRQVALRARKIIEVMTGSIRMPVLRGEAFLFHGIYRRYYDIVKVDQSGLIQLRIAARSHTPLVLMPSHRSYMDFLIVSYLFFQFELPLPHIAAGNDFLAMSLVNWFLRHSGAFFMRRSFRGDQVYRAVFLAYLQGILHAGSPLEFFMEGTRSRSGKSLTPKLGVLSMLVDLFTHDDSLQDMLLCPINIGYERMVEEDSHVRELLGEPKRRMSTIKMLKAFGERAFSSEFGRIHVQFGTPVSLRDYIAQQQTQGTATDLEGIQTPSPDNATATTSSAAFKDSSSEGQLSLFPTLTEEEASSEAAASEVARDHPRTAVAQASLVQGLGDLMMSRMMADTICSSTQLVSALLLGNRRGISLAALTEHYHWLSEELKRRGGRVDTFDGGPKEATLHALRLLDAAIVDNAGMLSVATPLPASSVQLSIYRNGILHLLVPDALAVLPLYARGGSVSLDRLLSDVRFLRRLLQREFVLEASSLLSAQTLINQAQSRDLLHIDPSSGMVSGARQHDELALRMCSFLCESLLPFIDTYWLTGALLASITPGAQCTEAELVSRIQWLAGQLGNESAAASVHGPRSLEIADHLRMTYPESCSVDTIRHALITFRVWNVYGLRGALPSGVGEKQKKQQQEAVAKEVAWVELLPPYNVCEAGAASPVQNLVDQIEVYRSPPPFIRDPTSIVELVRSYPLFARV